MSKKEKKDENAQLTPIRNEVSRLSSEIKKTNENYDQTIAEINAWKKEKHQELDEIERQIDLRYGGTVIDTDMQKRQKEAEFFDRNVQEDIKKEQEACEALSREINDLLGKDFPKKQ